MRVLRGLIVAVVVTAWPGVSVSAATAPWSPDHNVELMIPSAAGGGFDRTGRAIQKIWQTDKMLNVTVSVVNKPGGGGAVGWAYVNQHPGSGHHLGLCSPTLLTNEITGNNTLSYRDFTPIAQLFSEYLAFAVRADSKIADARDLLAQLKARPGALPIAIATAPGGPNHIGVALVARATGVDVRKQKIVFFKNGSESATALLGGHVAVMATSASNLEGLLQSGQIRVLAVAAPSRLEGAFASVPTWTEVGVVGIFANWRCVLGPRGLAAGQVAYWNQLLGQMVATPEWHVELKENGWDANYMKSADSLKFMQQQHELARRILLELGMAKQ